MVVSQNYIESKNRDYVHKATNVVELIKKAKLEEKKEKRQTLMIVAAAVSTLAISGFIIAL